MKYSEFKKDFEAFHMKSCSHITAALYKRKLIVYMMFQVRLLTFGLQQIKCTCFLLFTVIAAAF